MKKMIKTFTIGLILISSLIAHGETETVNGVTWNYTLESGEVTIDFVALGTNQTVTIPSTLGGAHVTSIGYEAFEGCSNLTHVTIPASVTDISPRVFEWCTSLQDFELAPGNANFKSDSGLLLSKDGKTLVMAARKLTSVTIPEGVTTIDYFAFYGCSNLEKVTIPNSVVEIGPFAFAKCRRLTQMRIPASVTNINFCVFSECSSLEGIEVDPDNVSFKSDSGLLLTRDGKILIAVPQSLSKVTIPSGVTVIGLYAFMDCNHLTNVTIPEGVKIVGVEAFKNCSNLTQVTIPESVTFIAERLFAGCTSLQGFKVAPDNAHFKSESGLLLTKSGRSVVAVAGGLTNLMIPDGVTYIRDRALEGNTNLTNVTIPASLTNISQWTFAGCANLTTFDVSPDNPNFSSASGLLLSKDGKTIIAAAVGLTDVAIPTSVTCIGESAFAGCRRLTHLTIPTHVERICVERYRQKAFESCNDSLFDTNTITGVRMVDGWIIDCDDLSGSLDLTGVHVRGIADNAFDGTDFEGRVGLTDVILPEGVTSIGDGAFAQCCGLTNVVIPASVKRIGNDAFSACCKLTNLTIPAGVAEIGAGAFPWCMKDLKVAPGNTNFKSVSGLLLSKDGKTIVAAQRDLTKVKIPDGVTDIGERAFAYCRGLTAVTIPASVRHVGSDAFTGCRGLTGITIPDGVTKIGDHAFKNCQGLRSMAIPASVTEIGNGVFSGCTMLKSVAVSPDSTHFKSESGLLLSKDGTTLIEVIGILTNTTLTSGSNELARADKAMTIQIPDGVTNIRDEVFEDCRGLASITIPASVTNIGDRAFRWVVPKGLVVEPGNPRYSVAYDCLLDHETGKWWGKE